MHRDEIPTPALLLDADRFERNLARMAAHVRKAGKHLRPHAKTHRCPEIARRQIAAGRARRRLRQARRGRGHGRRRGARPADHDRGGAAGLHPPPDEAGRRGARHHAGGRSSRQRAGPGARGRRGGGDAQRAGRHPRRRAAYRRRAGRTGGGARPARGRAAGAPAPRTAGLRRTVRARHGLGRARRGLPAGDGATDGDARPVREGGTAGRDRGRRLHRNVRHRRRAAGPHRAAVRLLLRDGSRLPAGRRSRRRRR